MINFQLPIQISGHVLIKDETTDEILLDKHNAIHTQNMARIIARGLSNEPHSTIYRIAFGNGGTFIDASNTTSYKPPNDGNNGAGWEARLYNEQYSEVVDESDALFGTDPGSAGSDNVRIGGGSCPEDDPSDGGVTSVEAGKSSNVIVKVYLNQNEPKSQLDTQSPIPSLSDSEKTFLFDEIGLYSSGKPALSTSGVTNIDVGTKTSEQEVGFSGAFDYDIEIDVDGVLRTTTVSVPAGGTGGTGGVTYGDLCEGFNSGSWLSDTSIADYVYMFINDTSNGTYPTIIGKESNGLLSFQSKSTGDTSTITLTCDADLTNLFYVLGNETCNNVNVYQQNGQLAGVQNYPANPDDERERLLSHLVFDPILKSADRVLSITYTLTVSVASSSDSRFSQSYNV
jgi:hypothetical protein